MASIRSVYIQEDSAERLYDLTAIRNDLTVCQEICVMMASQSGLSRAALFAGCISAAMMYCRAFERQSRPTVATDELTAALDSNDKIVHQRFRDFRDKYVAHPINRLEHFALAVWLNRDESDIGSVSVRSHGLMALAPVEYDALSGVCRKILEWVDAELASGQQAMTELLRKKYSIEEIRAMPDHSPGELRLDSINLRRGRTRYTDRKKK